MKKLNKHILEAVNRGIKLALDDFNDEVPIALSISKVKSKDLTSEWLDILNLVVDLGLPSGTLWCKYNLGASDIGDPGNYYAWGEVEPKNFGGWDTYKFKKDGIGLNKYCTDKRYGIVDNLTKLLPEDDAAYLNDNRFRIPTYKEFAELLKYTNIRKIRDTKGLVHIPFLKDYITLIEFTSKINGNKLYIPTGGLYRGLKLQEPKTLYLWGADLHETNDNYATLLIINTHTTMVLHEYRYYSNNIRPVLNL